MDQQNNPFQPSTADDDSPDTAAEDFQPPRVRARWGLNLFWRTFFMMALLLTFSTLGWLFLVRSVDLEPRARQTAQQIASLVNLSRTALIYSDTIARYALIKTLAEEEGVRILPREPEDVIVPMRPGQMAERITQELRRRLGHDTIVARAVNGENGLWIGFDIDDDPYWLLTDQSRIHQVGGATWLVWVLMAGLLSLTGAAVMAGIVNRPLRHLLAAISKVHKGDFKSGRLDETVATKEIRKVNIGFNRMAEQMAKAEQERAVMLAGISHDLRTPLARLRLEVEMSVPDPESQRYMAADIEQLDVIINKFMDYARPEAIEPAIVHLADVVQTCAYPYLNVSDMVVKIDVPHNLRVMADEVELGRVISNLMENARRYGKTPGTEVTELTIKAKADGARVLLQVYDRGSGVPEHQLADLTQPFFRADAARTSAVGSGLGLAIVKKVVDYMGGSLTLSNHPQGGLLASLRLPRAK
ncbi:MAG: ATP-binding protein [Brachymonas sp.]|nr:ATP-binding protein [Brachymonas sp.]